MIAQPQLTSKESHHLLVYIVLLSMTATALLGLHAVMSAK